MLTMLKGWYGELGFRIRTLACLFLHRGALLKDERRLSSSIAVVTMDFDCFMHLTTTDIVRFIHDRLDVKYSIPEKTVIKRNGGLKWQKAEMYVIRLPTKIKFIHHDHFLPPLAAIQASCSFFCLSQSFLSFFVLLLVSSSPAASLRGNPPSSHALNSVVRNISR